MPTPTVLEHPTSPVLRKRTKSLPLTSEVESSGSQLPSPLSSFDDEHDMLETDQSPLATPLFRPHRRKSTSSTQDSRKTRTRGLTTAETAADAQWTDIPLAVALIPPLGSFLTGGDFLRDFLLFTLLFFYLHQLIKLPWDLYLASRPRRRRVPREATTPDAQRLQDLAVSELRVAEFCYLGLSVLTPLIGAALLRYVGSVMTGREYISWFSTGIFVLVTGIRPWRHLGQRLRGRTEELQEVVYGIVRADNLEDRVDKLEKELAAMREVGATRRDLATLDEAFEGLEAVVGRHSRIAEGGRRAVDERFQALERSLEGVRTAPSLWSFVAPAILLNWVRPHSKSLSRASRVSGTRSSLRAGFRPRLAPVREEESDIAGLRLQDREKHASITFTWVEIGLAPLRIGRRLVWWLLNFLQHKLV